jgi:hypothetical protein
MHQNGDHAPPDVLLDEVELLTPYESRESACSETVTSTPPWHESDRGTGGRELGRQRPAIAQKARVHLVASGIKTSRQARGDPHVGGARWSRAVEDMQDLEPG